MPINDDPPFSLVKVTSIPVAKFVGLLYFISRCDNLLFQCDFTKKFCFKTFLCYNELIRPESLQRMNSDSQTFVQVHGQVFLLIAYPEIYMFLST